MLQRRGYQISSKINRTRGRVARWIVYKRSMLPAVFWMQSNRWSSNCALDLFKFHPSVWHAPMVLALSHCAGHTSVQATVQELLPLKMSSSVSPARAGVACAIQPCSQLSAQGSSCIVAAAWSSGLVTWSQPCKPQQCLLVNHRSFRCEGSRRAGGAAGVMGLREGVLQQIHLSRRFLPKVSQIVVSQDLAKATWTCRNFHKFLQIRLWKNTWVSS